MSFSDVVGHERALRVLKSTLMADRVPHAYLFWGPEGIGKELVAGASAGVLLCSVPGAAGRAEACGSCPSCRKVSGGSHPDLHQVVAKGASISVDDIRALQETLSFQAFERGRKVAIIRDAFRMTREASNALLKTLEEPPLGTHLFLLAHHRNQLLPTLVSRCQALRFDPLAQADVARLLEARGVESVLANALSAACAGSPGTALAEDPEVFDSLAREGDEARGALASGEVSVQLAQAARWSSDKERLGRRLDGLERGLRTKLLSSGGTTVDDPSLEAMAGVLHVRRLLDQNVNVQLALDALFLGLLGQPPEGSL